MGVSYVLDIDRRRKLSPEACIYQGIIRLLVQYGSANELVEFEFGDCDPEEQINRLVARAPDILVATAPVIEQWLNRKGGNSVITILIGCPSDELRTRVDVVIDPLSSDTREYFSGLKFLPKEILEYTDLGALQELLDLDHSTIQAELEQNGAIHALSEITSLYRILDWDSEFFEFPVAFVTTRRLTRNIERFIKERVRANKVRFLEYCCNCHDPVSVRTAEDNGYRFVDIRVTLEKYLSSPEQFEGSPSLRPSSDLEVVQASDSDLDYLIPATKSLYLDSRYFFDGHFAKDKLHQFYADWLKKSVRGDFDDCVFLIRDRRQKHRPFGFCSFRRKMSTDQVAVIGLFGIDPTAQRQGYARALLNGVFHQMYSRGFNKVEVVTQGRNLAAQRIYQKTGFVTQMMELWYHKWLY